MKNSLTTRAAQLPSPPPPSSPISQPFQRAPFSSTWRLLVAKLIDHTTAFGMRNDSYIIEDVEANKFISISETQLWWIQLTFYALLKNPVERFFKKAIDIDRSRMKISKFQANLGWILSCDLWSYSRGHFALWVCFGVNKQGWSSFCKMLEKFVDIVDYSSWFLDNSSKVPLRPLVEKPSYVEMVKFKNSKEKKNRTKAWKKGTQPNFQLSR